MGSGFEDWANGYFSLDSGNLDKQLPRDEVFNDYTRYSNMNRITMQGFTKKLKAFCQICPWIDELNPREQQNSSGRIQRKVPVTINGISTMKVKDMIYVKSKPIPTAEEDDSMAADEKKAETQKEGTLFNDAKEDCPF